MDLLPGQVVEHLYDLRNQGLLKCCGGFINILFSDAPDIIDEGVAVWAARWLSLLVGGCFRRLRSFFCFLQLLQFRRLSRELTFSEAIIFVLKVLLNYFVNQVRRDLQFTCHGPHGL